MNALTCVSQLVSAVRNLLVQLPRRRKVNLRLRGALPGLYIASVCSAPRCVQGASQALTRQRRHRHREVD
jgi:hypothetical protein